LSESAPGVPPAVETLVAQMLDKDPSERPTADRVAAELERAWQPLVAVRSSNGPDAHRSGSRSRGPWRWVKDLFRLTRRVFINRRA
jgi:hypothetical protein